MLITTLNDSVRGVGTQNVGRKLGRFGSLNT
jgi:hypothetical protein